MKTETTVRRRTAGLGIALVAIALSAMIAAPAMAIDEAELLVIQGIHLPAQIEQAPITDGGDWEMVPHPTFPDAGSDEICAPDDFGIVDGGGDEMVPTDEAEVPDGGSDEGGQEADVPDEPDEPEQSHEETATTGDESHLPFTGGNETPYVIAGLLVALGGVALLLGKRHVFDR